MASKITNDILDASLKCHFKAHLKLGDQHGDKSDYEVMLTDLRAEVRRRSLEKILSQQSIDEVEQGVALTPATLKRRAAFILDAVLDDDYFRLRLDGIPKHTIDRWPRQASHSGDLSDGLSYTTHLVDSSDLIIADLPTPSLVTAAPCLPTTASSSLTSSNTLGTDLGLVLGNRRKNASVKATSR